LASEEQVDGGVRFLLRRGGGSFAARSLLRRSTRPGDGAGVANAKGGCIEVGSLKRIADDMVIKNNYVRSLTLFSRFANYDGSSE
jgi:hypothetical protein